jgi:hypothetical protein
MVEDVEITRKILEYLAQKDSFPSHTTEEELRQAN